MARSRQRNGHRGLGATAVGALFLVGACATASPAPVATGPLPAATGSTVTAAPASPPAEGATNPDGCPEPTAPISVVEYASTVESCFPGGVTLDGWFHRDAAGVILLGTRPGSVAEHTGPSITITVSLPSGQTLPAEAGYGRFVSTGGSNTQSSLTATAVTLLPNPASSCPTADPIPVAVFLESLARCYKPAVDVTISGWRDTLDGLCGCSGVQWDETPAWLTGEDGFGWLFAQPQAIESWTYLTLHAPNVHTLGVDSGARPTYMAVTGHFGDAAAAICRARPIPGAFPAGGPSGADVKAEAERLKAECADRFVVTHLREIAAPPTALGFCPAGPPYTVASVLGARVMRALMEQLCFGGHDATITGWFDPQPAQGEVDPYVPAWLDAGGRPALWPSVDAPRDPAEGLVLFVNPASGVSLPTTAGWYAMTGHFNDPAAASCVRTDGANSGNSWAEACREEFVVTRVGP